MRLEKALLICLGFILCMAAITVAQPQQGIVHVVLFMHNEDSALGNFSLPETRDRYIRQRNGLVQFANMVRNNDVAFCWQSDWTFLEGVLRYEIPELMTTTNGKNLVRWLKEDIGMSVDPHSHENYGYNYADVAHLIDSLGVTPTSVIGGHIYDPYSEKFQDWERFRAPLYGEKYPHAVWNGNILMGSGTPNHTYDPAPSGIWRPKGKYEYWTDDPSGNITCVGQYTGDVAGVQELVNLYKSGQVPPGDILTASIYVGQSFPPGAIQAYENDIVRPLLEMQERGEIRIVNFVELVDIWTEQYDERAHIYNMPENGPDTVRTYIPSSAGGGQGIYTRITFPENPRYAPHGAPVVVHVPGGWDGVGVGPARGDWPLTGFIEIRFNFPGSGRPDARSGGVYDDRGENCLRALCDIGRFALGMIADKSGTFLQDYPGGLNPVLTNVGFCGWSHGGNAAIAAAGAFGQELEGLAWIATYESPVGDGMPNTEAGGGDSGPNPAVNPAYDPETGSWDLDCLAWDNGLKIGDSPQIRYNGGLYFDINNNNTPDAGTDFILTPYFYQNKAFYSVRVRRSAKEQNLIPAISPEHIPTLDQTVAFWQYRDGENWIAQAVQKNPLLMFLVEANEDDHVQNAPDHPHVLNQYEGFRKAGARFVRLNPDRSFVEEMTGRAMPHAADNDAFMVFDHLSIRQALQPDGVPMNACVAAGITELADRTQFNNLDIQIDGTLTGIEKQAQPETFCNLMNYPNPFNPSTNITFFLDRYGPVNLTVYDVLGREVEVLVDKTLSPGRHEYRFDTQKYHPGLVAGGTYFLHLRTDTDVFTRKILFLR